MADVLEHAVAKAMPDDVGAPRACRQGRRGPEAAGLFIAQEERLAAAIAHRVVMPGGEAEFVGILAPGVSRTALRDDGAEVRIGQHVHPGRGCDFAGRQRKDIFAPVGGEATQPVGQNQIAPRERDVDGLVGFGTGRAAWRKPRYARLHRPATVELFRQGTAVVNDHGARDRLEQDAILGGDLLCRTHEDAARSVDHARLDARSDQSHDLVLQLLAITGVILVPDHQVHREPFQAPVGMGLHQLTHQIHIGRIADLQQHNRQIAGDGVAPQPGLPTPIADQHGGVGAQGGVGVNDRAGQARIQLRIGLTGIELA